MRYDASNHPNPRAFNAWAKGGRCPYEGVQWGRAAHFAECRELWKPGPAQSALKLAQRLLKEKCVMVGAPTKERKRR